MALLRMNRCPGAYGLATVGVLMLHTVLCYPAAVSRGYPPIRPFDFLAIFLAPAGMIIPPLFADFRQDDRSKLLRTAWIACGFCFVWGVVDTNMSSPRPHIGHLEGVVGLVESHTVEVVFRGGLYFPIALLFFFCLEGVMNGVWSLIRGFRSTSVLSKESRSIAEPDAAADRSNGVRLPG